jgi:hypothetical protein
MQIFSLSTSASNENISYPFAAAYPLPFKGSFLAYELLLCS